MKVRGREVLTEALVVQAKRVVIGDEVLNVGGFMRVERVRRRTTESGLERIRLFGGGGTLQVDVAADDLVCIL